MRLYDGPIFDAHHHSWRYDPDQYGWLAASGDADLMRDVGTGDLLAACAGLNLAGSVWIEALAQDPLTEAKTAREDHELHPGLARALVAHAPLDAPDIGDRLDALATALPALRGIRDIVAVRPGHASFARSETLLRCPAFAEGLRACRDRGLVFDLMLEPWQMDDALVAIGAAPGVEIVIEHAGSPDFSSPRSAALWRDAMAKAAEAPNVAVKISALHCRMPDWTDARLSEPILWLIERFGVDRLAFASDFPVHDKHCPLARAYETFRRATASLAAGEQRALFHDNARRWYRV